MKDLIVFIILICLAPYIIIIIISKLWDKILLKLILIRFWGEILTNEYYGFEENELVKDMTIKSNLFVIRGLLNPILPDNMKQFIFKINGLSGIIQYTLLGVLIAIGTSCLAHQCNLALTTNLIFWICIINAIWLIILRTPWLPIILTLFVFLLINFVSY
jgi:hypothetical protein